MSFRFDSPDDVGIAAHVVDIVDVAEAGIAGVVDGNPRVAAVRKEPSQAAGADHMARGRAAAGQKEPNQVGLDHMAAGRAAAGRKMPYPVAVVVAALRMEAMAVVV